MVVAAKLYVEHADLPLSPTIRAHRDAEFGVYSDAGTDPEHDVYFVWVETADYDAVEESLAADHTVAEYVAIVDTEDRRTYRIDYSADATLLSPAVVDAGCLLVESRSYSKGWLFHLQLRDHGDLFTINEYARGHDVHLDVLELRQNQETEDGLEFGLTSAQQEALVSAYVQGYYDEPRETSLEGLGASLGITSTSVSGRLRRGSARLIEAVLVDEEE